MKYLVLLYADPTKTKALSAAELDEVDRRHEALRIELTRSGELLDWAGLALPVETRTIRLQDGAPRHVDGPLVEANEHLTAYYLIDCADAARAQAVAEGLLAYHVTAVELRHLPTAPLPPDGHPPDSRPRPG